MLAFTLPGAVQALRWAARGAAVAGGLAVGAGTAVAGSADRADLKPLTVECLEQAAAAFGHPTMALTLILAQERGKVGECSRPNKNGTVDCGAAQINQNEIPKIARVIGLSNEETFRRVRDDGCFNIFVSSYILAQKKRDARGDLWDAMGRYNSATPGIKEQYQEGLLRQYRRLFVEGGRIARGGGGGPASRERADKALRKEGPREVAEMMDKAPPNAAKAPSAEGQPSAGMVADGDDRGGVRALPLFGRGDASSAVAAR